MTDTRFMLSYLGNDQFIVTHAETKVCGVVISRDEDGVALIKAIILNSDDSGAVGAFAKLLKASRGLVDAECPPSDKRTDESAMQMVLMSMIHQKSFGLWMTQKQGCSTRFWAQWSEAGCDDQLDLYVSSNEPNVPTEVQSKDGLRVGKVTCRGGNDTVSINPTIRFAFEQYCYRWVQLNKEEWALYSEAGDSDLLKFLRYQYYALKQEPETRKAFLN